MSQDYQAAHASSKPTRLEKWARVSGIGAILSPIAIAACAGFAWHVHEVDLASERAAAAELNAKLADVAAAVRGTTSAMWVHADDTVNDCRATNQNLECTVTNAADHPIAACLFGQLSQRRAAGRCSHFRSAPVGWDRGRRVKSLSLGRRVRPTTSATRSPRSATACSTSTPATLRRLRSIRSRSLSPYLRRTPRRRSRARRRMQGTTSARRSTYPGGHGNLKDPRSGYLRRREDPGPVHLQHHRAVDQLFVASGAPAIRPAGRTPETAPSGARSG
jgi:hypothetical protein